MKKVFILTMGCQMNKSDSEKMYSILANCGYKKTEEEKSADLLMINTCSIRKLSEDKAYSRIGTWSKLKKSNPNIKIAFCGCVAQVEAQKIFKRAPYVDLILGTRAINDLPLLIKKIEKDQKVIAVADRPLVEADYKIKREKNVNCWITIIEGCNNFCTYCIVPFTRGRQRSRDPKDILNEVKTALNEGYKEITLLGQNVDSYGKDLNEQNTTLANLLRQINAIEGRFRIRFVTSYPSDITDDLICAVKECSKVCEYFHIPMQSGSSEILKAMNRRYSRDEYAKIVKRIKNVFPEATITSDFIAGFPGESEEQFNETISAIDEFEIDYSNTAAYSPREGTAAAKMVDKFIDEETKQKRLKILNDKIKEASTKSNAKCIEKTFEVLIEKKEGNSLEGRLSNNKIVHFKGELEVGDFCEVKIVDSKLWCVKGELINAQKENFARV